MYCSICSEQQSKRNQTYAECSTLTNTTCWFMQNDFTCSYSSWSLCNLVRQFWEEKTQHPTYCWRKDLEQDVQRDSWGLKKESWVESLSHSLGIFQDLSASYQKFHRKIILNHLECCGMHVIWSCSWSWPPFPPGCCDCSPSIRHTVSQHRFIPWWCHAFPRWLRARCLIPWLLAGCPSPHSTIIHAHWQHPHLDHK